MKRKSIAKILLAVSMLGLASAGTVLTQPKKAEASVYGYYGKHGQRYVVASWTQFRGNLSRSVTRYSDGTTYYGPWHGRRPMWG